MSKPTRVALLHSASPAFAWWHPSSPLQVSSEDLVRRLTGAMFTWNKLLHLLHYVASFLIRIQSMILTRVDCIRSLECFDALGPGLDTKGMFVDEESIQQIVLFSS